jgi:hypothetical protein
MLGLFPHGKRKMLLRSNKFFPEGKGFAKQNRKGGELNE